MPAKLFTKIAKLNKFCANVFKCKERKTHRWCRSGKSCNNIYKSS